MTAQPFSVAHDGSLYLLTQVANKVNAIIYRTQLLEKIIDDSCQTAPLLAVVNDGVYHIMMSFYHCLKLHPVCLITSCRQP